MSTGLIWIIMIVVMILSQIIQSMLQSRFEKYSRVPTNNRMTGAEIATKMLADNGITDVKVTCIPGRLTDHYNPQTKTVNLSEAVYNSSSVAAAALDDLTEDPLWRLTNAATSFSTPKAICRCNSARLSCRS